jgi:hypothetical protein
LLLGAMLFSLGKNYYAEHYKKISSFIDFNKSGYTEQLVSGWYDLETPPSGGYRWTGKRAVARLSRDPDLKHISASIYIHDITVYKDSSLDVDLQVNDQTVKSGHFDKPGLFKIDGNVPSGLSGDEITVAISLNKIYVPSEIGKGDDKRQLGVVVNSIGLGQ